MTTLSTTKNRKRVLKEFVGKTKTVATQLPNAIKRKLRNNIG